MQILILTDMVLFQNANNNPCDEFTVLVFKNFRPDFNLSTTVTSCDPDQYSEAGWTSCQLFPEGMGCTSSACVPVSCAPGDYSALGGKTLPTDIPITWGRP